MSPHCLLKDDQYSSDDEKPNKKMKLVYTVFDGLRDSTLTAEPVGKIYTYEKVTNIMTKHSRLLSTVKGRRFK
jgi:hypothetical protein